MTYGHPHQERRVQQPTLFDGKSVLRQRSANQTPDGPEQSDAFDDHEAPDPDAESPAPDPGDDAGDPDEDTDANRLPLDQVFEILKNSRRRQTLHYLNDNGGEASLSDLAEHIAAIENDTTVEAISSSQRKRVYVGLYQCHLPKMDDMNIVDFEQNRGTIELAENADQLEPYLDDSQDQAWYKLYSTVTGVGVGLFSISMIGSSPFGLTPATVLVALLGVMVLCSLFHAYVEFADAPESAT